MEQCFGIRLFGGHFNEKRYEEERTHQRYCRRLQRRSAACNSRVQHRLGEHGAYGRREQQRRAGFRHDRAGHGGRTQRPDHGRGRGGSGSDLSAARPRRRRMASAPRRSRSSRRRSSPDRIWTSTLSAAPPSRPRRFARPSSMRCARPGSTPRPSICAPSSSRTWP